MKTVLKIPVYFILFVFLISAAGCSSGKVKVMPAMQNKTDIKAKQHKIVVAETRTIDKYLSVDATISYDGSEELSFKIDYYNLKAVYVEKDDTVSEGQLLAELDASDLENRLAIRRVDLERVQLRYNHILSEPGTEDSGRNTQLESLKLDMESIQLDINRLTELIGETKLVAPYSGLITDVVDFEAGQMVQAYKKMMTICKPEEFILQTGVLNPADGPDSGNLDISGVVTGMKVTIIHGSGKTMTEIPATITRIINIDPGIVANPSRILAAPARLRIFVKPDGKDTDKLFVTRTVTIKIFTGKLENVVVLPRSAIAGYGEDLMVSVVKDDKVITRRIATGYEDKDEKIIVITSGLRAGESVIAD